MPLIDFLRLVWLHRLLFAAVCAVTLGLTAILLSIWPRSYAATTRVLVDVGRARESLTDGPSASQLAPGFMMTQVDIIRSHRVATQAVRVLGLERSATARSIWDSATGGRGSPEQFFAERLLARMKVSPAQQSNVIEIEFRAPEPRFAADVANAIAQAYIATQLELKVAPAREFAEFFEQQSAAVRTRYDEAHRRLTQFQRQHGIVSIDERLDVENNRLQELSTQLTQLQAVRAESAGKAGVAGRGRDGTSDLAEVVNNPVVAQLRADIARAEARLSELSGQYGPRYPLVERARDELDALRANLRQHTVTVGSTISRQHEVNLGREAELAAALAVQRQRVLDLKRQRDQMAVLARDVDSTHRSLDLLTQRLLQHKVEGEARGTNVVQLDPAVPPLDPASPNVPVVVAASAVAAPMLASLAVALVGAMRRRALVVADVSDALGSPTVLPIPRSRAIARARRSAPRLIEPLPATAALTDAAGAVAEAADAVVRREELALARHLPEVDADGCTRIGAIMIDLQMLRLDQAERVLELQRSRGGRFGEAAIALGFATPAQVQLALARQRGASRLLPGDRERLDPELRAALDDPQVARAFTDVRTQLELRWFDGSPERRTLALVSEAPGEGRSLAVAMIGLMLAMTGRRVLLVDACVESPRLAALFGTGAGPVSLADAMARPDLIRRQPTALDSVELSVIAARPRELDGDSIASQGFARFLAATCSEWDAILVDTPPWSLDRRAVAVAVRCSAALPSVRLGRVPMRRLEEMRRMLADSGVETLGALAQRF